MTATATGAPTAVDDRPVIVVGGGPTGLTAALELAYHGVPSIVLEAGRQRGDGSRAIALHRTALLVWERLGCAEPMLEQGTVWLTRRTFFREREVHTLLMPEPSAGELPTFVNLPQYRTEDCLLRRLRATSSIDLHWEHRVVGVVQTDSGVTVEAQTPDGTVRVSGSYLLACDGARSSVRKLLALRFPGTTYPDRFLIADIRTDLPLPPEPRFFFDHPTNPRSTVLIHPQPDGVWRIDWQLGHSASVADECAPDALRRRIRGLIGELPYELVWLSDYQFHQRQLARLRHGRVFFLGDAAHLVAPFGARGLNSAIHDVENLGWKLAWAIQGRAPESLLDTYQQERWPAQRHDQRVTNATMRFMAPRTRAQRLRRGMILRLSTVSKAARRRVNSGRMSQPFTYRSSPILVREDGWRERWPNAPRPGARVPDVACRIVAELPVRDAPVTWLRRLIGGGFLALYFAADDADALRFAAGVRAERHPGWVAVRPVLPEAPRVCGVLPAIWDHIGAIGKGFAAEPGALFLVRPDGHLAARRRRARPADVARLVAVAAGNSPTTADGG